MSLKKYIFAFLFFMPFTLCYGMNTFRQGMTMFEEGNFEGAKSTLCPLARKGNVLAQAYIEEAENLLQTPRELRFKSKKPFGAMSAKERAYVAPAEEWVKASVMLLMYRGTSLTIPKDANNARKKIKLLMTNDRMNANAWCVAAEMNAASKDKSFDNALFQGEYRIAHQISKSNLNKMVGNQGDAFLSLLRELQQDGNESNIYWRIYQFVRPHNKAMAKNYLKMALFHGNGDALFPYLEGGFLSSEEEGDRMVHWFAAHGHKPALCTIGYYFEQGSHGFPQDLKEAFRLYSEAANGEDGYPVAQFNCGNILRQKKGKRNLEKALKYFRHSFNNGRGDKNAAEQMRETLQELYETHYSGEENIPAALRKIRDQFEKIRTAHSLDTSESRNSTATAVLGTKSKAENIDLSEALQSALEELQEINAHPQSSLAEAADTPELSLTEKFYAEAIEILQELPFEYYTEETSKLLSNLLLIHHQKGSPSQRDYIENFLSENRQYYFLFSELCRQEDNSLQIELANQYLLRALKERDPAALLRISIMSVPEFEQLAVTLKDFEQYGILFLSEE
ncbi:MAG: sel1 repeat family protein [Proteobacteria bacterium]|nr:sel1 repeat family protein [Pseudomonadota bacterium]